MEHKPGIGKRAMFCPSLWGGKDWPPAAYNPGTGYLYIPANENLCQHLVGEDVEYRPRPAVHGCADRHLIVAEGADHIGELQAWNLRTGEQVWTHEFASPNWGPVLTTGRRAGLLRRHQRPLFPRVRRCDRQAPLAVPDELGHHGRANVVRSRRRAVHRRAVGLGRRRARHDWPHRPRARHEDDRAAGRRRLGVRARAVAGRSNTGPHEVSTTAGTSKGLRGGRLKTGPPDTPRGVGAHAETRPRYVGRTARP